MVKAFCALLIAVSGLAAMAKDAPKKLDNGIVIIGKAIKFQDLGYDMYMAKMTDSEGTCYFWVQMKGEEYMGRLDVSQPSCVKR